MKTEPKSRPDIDEWIESLPTEKYKPKFKNMKKQTISHEKAIERLLLNNSGKWIPLPEIERYTKLMCKSECHAVNSRISDLRTKLKPEGYEIDNDQKKVDGVTHSFYMLRLA